jgi:hypothetical protein
MLGGMVEKCIQDFVSKTLRKETPGRKGDQNTKIHGKEVNGSL